MLYKVYTIHIIYCYINLSKKKKIKERKKHNLNEISYSIYKLNYNNNTKLRVNNV